MDIEAALVPTLQAVNPTARVLTSTPNNLDAILPVIKVADTGGSGTMFRMDAQGVEIDVFAAAKGAAQDLAWSVYHWLMEQTPVAFGNIGVLRVDASSLPVETSYANPDVHRYSFHVIIHTHDRRF